MWDRKAERIAKYNKKKERLEQRRNRNINTKSIRNQSDRSNKNRRAGLLRDKNKL